MVPATPLSPALEPQRGPDRFRIGAPGMGRPSKEHDEGKGSGHIMKYLLNWNGQVAEDAEVGFKHLQTVSTAFNGSATICWCQGIVSREVLKLFFIFLGGEDGA